MADGKKSDFKPGPKDSYWLGRLKKDYQSHSDNYSNPKLRKRSFSSYQSDLKHLSDRAYEGITGERRAKKRATKRRTKRR